jgi:hypothetical protein
MGVIDLIDRFLQELGFFEWLKQRIEIGPEWKAKAAAYFLVPGMIAGIYITYGGGLSIDFGKGMAISELKSEITQGGVASSKRGVLIIAEPVLLNSKIPLQHDSAKIWSSLDEQRAARNAAGNHLGLNGPMLYFNTPFFEAESEPVVMIVEGAMADHIEVHGKTESVQNWRLSSRRSTSIVSAVLLNCFMALGIGLATGVAPVDPNKHDTGKKRTKPNKK